MRSWRSRSSRSGPDPTFASAFRIREPSHLDPPGSGGVTPTRPHFRILEPMPRKAVTKQGAETTAPTDDPATRVAMLRERIERANALYYEQDAPEISDAE